MSILGEMDLKVDVGGRFGRGRLDCWDEGGNMPIEPNVPAQALQSSRLVRDLGDLIL